MIKQLALKAVRLIILINLYSSCHACSETNPNCTVTNEPDVTKEYMEVNSSSNLAWLVTPALFGLGVIFFIYKCCRDGLCNCRRLRRRAAMEYQREHGYIPLSQVVLHTNTPDNGEQQLPPGQRRHLVVIHNQTFCITLRDTPNACPGASQCLHADQPHICVQQVPGQPPQATIVGPPSYEEATSNVGECAEHPPRYSEACDEEEENETELPGELTALPKLASPQPKHNRQVRFDTRRRHFSAQDRRELHSPEDSNDELRQRCFSFNALRDTFRRNSSSSREQPDRETLLQGVGGSNRDLHDIESDSVFLSVELIGPDGASGGQPMALPQNIQIINNIDSIEVLTSNTTTTRFRRFSVQDRRRHFSGPPGLTLRGGRSRHASAPDTSRKGARSRNASGQ